MTLDPDLARAGNLAHALSSLRHAQRLALRARETLCRLRHVRSRQDAAGEPDARSGGVVPLLHRLPHRHRLHGRAHHRQPQAAGDAGAVPPTSCARIRSISAPTSPSGTSRRCRPFSASPGDTAKGGLPFEEYMRRQDLHRRAEINALLDTPSFISARATSTAIPTWSCDTGGSICEVVDPEDPEDEVLRTLSPPIRCWSGSKARRRIRPSWSVASMPRPSRCITSPDFLLRLWQEYLDTHGLAPDAVDPDAFVRFAYARALAHRAPLYAAMARNWGVSRHRRRGRKRARRRRCHRLVAAALGRHARTPR
jgi:hypothetical protein